MVANQRSNTVNRSTKSVGKDISALSSRKPFLAKKQTLELVFIFIKNMKMRCREEKRARVGKTVGRGVRCRCAT